MDVVDESKGIPTLEDRLAHFMKWLKDYGVHMTWADPNAHVTQADTEAMIEEYVNE